MVFLAATSPIPNQANPIHHDPGGAAPAGTSARFTTRHPTVAESVATCEHSLSPVQWELPSRGMLPLPCSISPTLCPGRCAMRTLTKKAALGCLRCPHWYTSGCSPPQHSTAQGWRNKVHGEEGRLSALLWLPQWVSVGYREYTEA